MANTLALKERCWLEGLRKTNYEPVFGDVSIHIPPSRIDGRETRWHFFESISLNREGVLHSAMMMIIIFNP